MELRHIRYFLVLAEELNFTRAAARLGISQPPLSMQIKQLEQEIGTELFYRTTNGAELTPAGSAFYTSVKPIAQRLQDAVATTQEVANGSLGTLRLGYTGTAMLHPLLRSVIRLYQQQYPKIQLQLSEANSLVLLERLQRDELDIAIVRPPQVTPADLNMQILLTETMVVALPAEHPCQAMAEIPLLLLQDDFFIVSPASVSSGLFDAIRAACFDHGFEPKMWQNAPQIVSILSLVAANLGVTLVPESAKQLAITGLRYRSISEPTPTVEMALAYPKLTHSQAAINFSSLIHTLLKRPVNPD